MNTLLIGCSGYIGSHLIKRMRSKNRDMRIDGIDTGWFSKDITGVVRPPEQGLDQYKPMDMRNIGKDDLKGYDCIIQLGAVSNDPIGDKFGNATRSINKEATCRIYEIASEVNVRSYVFASSCSVYGIDSGIPKKEDDELSPLTEYAKSKIECEQFFERLNSDIRTTNLRFATACGYTSRTRLDLVLNEFVVMALTEKKITIKSDGTPWRPLIHVEDMCKAIEWAMTREQGEKICTVNVGTESNNIRMKDLAAKVSAQIDNCDIDISASSGNIDKRSYQVDFSKYKKLSSRNNKDFMSIDDSIKDLRENLSKIEDLSTVYKKGLWKRLYRLNEYLSEGVLDKNLNWVL